MNELLDIMKKQWLAIGFAGTLACLFALPALAQTGSVQKEINTAHAHAVMAQSADTVKMSHTHLHHVINCLAGPDGKAFDPNAANPCKGQGNGAIPDSQGNADLQGKLQSALADAKSGLQADSLKAIHQNAAEAAGALKAASAQKSSGDSSW